MELLWCGLLFLWGSLPGRIPQQQLCAGRAEQRLRWCVLKLCIHTWRWQDTQTWPCVWLCFAATLMHHHGNIPHTWWLICDYQHVVFTVYPCRCVSMFPWLVWLITTLFCIDHAKLCDTAPLYQGQVLMGGWWVPSPVKPSLAFPSVITHLYDTTLPFLLPRLSGQSLTHRCVHVQLCKSQVPFCISTGVIVTGISLHSWGRVCRHNSEDESSLETDTVNFRAIVALERVVVCCTYECSY